MTSIPQYAFKAEDIVRSGRVQRSKIDEIKAWLNTRPEFPEVTDEQIVLFLISCYNVIENTKITIRQYFKLRNSAPEIFCNRDIDSPDLVKSCNTLEVCAFPKRTKQGHILIFSKFRDTYFRNYDVEASMKVTFMLIESLLHDYPPNGLITLYDMKGVGLMHLTRIRLGALKKFFTYLQEGLPCKLKEIHIFNVNYVFEKLIYVLKPFMKKELFEMLKPHPPNCNMDEFFEKHVQADCIPSNYGGTLQDTAELHDATIIKLRNLRSYFEATENQSQLYAFD